MNKRKKSKLIPVIIVAIFAYFVYIAVNQQNIMDAKHKEMEAIQAKIEAERKLNEELKEQKKNVNSDEYIEKMAREKLGMVKSGEKVFVDIDK